METELELIRLIYDAIPDASRWQAFLHAFVRATGARSANFALVDLRTERANGVCWVGWSDESMRSYVRYAAEDPWRLGVLALPEGFVGTNLDACSDEEMHASVAFREFYGPHDCYHGLGGVILRRETAQSILVAQRGRADGPFSERALTLYRRLMPHLQRAALLHNDWASHRAQLSTFTDHLDRYPHPFLLADANCRVLYANAVARKFAGAANGLTIHEGRLQLGAVKSDAVLREAVREIAADRRFPMRRLDIPSSPKQPESRLLLVPIPQSSVLTTGIAQPVAAILIIDPTVRPQPDPAILQELYSLTPTETKVTAKLVFGQNVDEIASEMEISPETVRTHVRRILSKTGTRRQGELVSLVLRASPFHKI